MVTPLPDVEQAGAAVEAEISKRSSKRIADGTGRRASYRRAAEPAIATGNSKLAFSATFVKRATVERLQKEWENWRTLMRELRKRPQLAILPFMTLVVFVFCGIFSVQYTANKATSVAQDQATTLMASVVSVRPRPGSAAGSQNTCTAGLQAPTPRCASRTSSVGPRMASWNSAHCRGLTGAGRHRRKC